MGDARSSPAGSAVRLLVSDEGKRWVPMETPKNPSLLHVRQVLAFYMVLAEQVPCGSSFRVWGPRTCGGNDVYCIFS